jgi:hypothetical protein
MSKQKLTNLNLKAFLVGHYGSKKILEASSYLNKKYLPSEIEVTYLNFGNFNKKKLHGFNYKSFGYFGSGKKYWSANLLDALKKIDDDLIFIALDDFFLSKKMNIENLLDLYTELIQNDEYIAAELTLSPMEKAFGLNEEKNNIYIYPKTYGFTVNTQWRIWKRKYLISLLEKTTDAWNFEIQGSQILNNTKYRSISSYLPILDYPEISAITQRNKNKVSVFANQYGDINTMIQNGYIKSDELILGQWKRGIPGYSKYSDNQYKVLKYIDDENEKKYYKLLLDRCLE